VRVSKSESCWFGPKRERHLFTATSGYKSTVYSLPGQKETVNVNRAKNKDNTSQHDFAVK